MALRIRRGTDAQRTGKTFEMGEIVYTTDSQQVWIGNGITAGGVPVVGSNVAGYGLTYNNVSNKLEVSGLTSDDVTQGINNKYFSTELAVDAVGAALVAGNATNVGITFTYAQTQDDAGRINATVALDGVGLTDVVNDTSPQLGGNLDINSHNITGTGDISITGDITASTGTITADAYGTVNAKKVYITDDVPGGDINAGFVITSSQSPADGEDWFTFNSHHNLVEDFHALLFKRTRGTSASPTALQADDFIFGLTFSGRTTDGSTAAAASIASFVSGTPGAGILPGSLALATADATGVVGPKLIVGPDGQQTIFAPSLTAGVGSGQVDVSTVSTWMKVNFNGVDYAVPMYAINP
jgi:hypothetical protein